MIDHQQLKISPGQYWDLFLHQDQTVLGRSYFWYKGEVTDLMNVPERAALELINNGKRLKRTLEELFHPDQFNYSSLNNRTKHLHFHVIPRYREPREFMGTPFIDEHFGESYQSNQGVHLHPTLLAEIKDVIAQKYLVLR
ncbi:MAG: HIT domain-containing protein [Candidatus Woesearchaeota archaeon]